MLINNWYVAEDSSAVVADKPLRVRMLGFDFVLFRDAAGTAHCLSDVCCHRGGALGDGNVVTTASGDVCVACPYHGWQFDTTGACVHIPALGAERAIPRRARIDVYPTVEKYGWIWVFLGDLPAHERPQIPDLFPEFDDPSWRKLPYRFEAKCNWMRMEENSLDTAHTNFVHKAFGSRRDPKLETFPITPTPWGAKVARTKPAPPAAVNRTTATKAIIALRRLPRRRAGVFGGRAGDFGGGGGPPTRWPNERPVVRESVMSLVMSCLDSFQRPKGSRRQGPCRLKSHSGKPRPCGK